MFKKLFVAFMMLALAFAGLFTPQQARADEAVDNGGVIATAVKDSTTGKLFVNLDLSKTGLGIDSPAWMTHVRLSAQNGVNSWVVPQKAVNLLEVDATTGLVKWQIFDERRDDYVLAAGEVNLGTSRVQKVDLYTQEGYYHLNGRHWFTECEPYSQTTRCRTEIWATQVTQEGGRFVQKNAWTFNNLTYLPSPRSLWAGNPLGHIGQWSDAEGREWLTDCDSAKTGRNGCRTWVLSDVIHARSGGFIRTESWVFNNIVQFS